MYCGRRQNPAFQALIPLVCAVIVILVVGNRRLRWTAVALLWSVFVFLMHTYTTVVNGPHYVGAPEQRGIAAEQINAEWHTPLTNMYRVRAVGPVGCRAGRNTAAPSS